jgi:hypothetical protein
LFPGVASDAPSDTMGTDNAKRQGFAMMGLASTSGVINDF